MSENSGIKSARVPTPVLAVSCSESSVLSAILLLLDASCVMQNLGGTLPAELPEQNLPNPMEHSGWGTVVYAIDHLGVRRILLCGHSLCCVPAMWIRGDWGTLRLADSYVLSADPVGPSGAKDRLAQMWLAEQIARLRGFLAGRHHASAVAVHAMWVNEERGEILLYSEASQRFVGASQADIEALFKQLDIPPDRAREMALQLHNICER